jgi:hypothetical protein
MTVTAIRDNEKEPLPMIIHRLTRIAAVAVMLSGVPMLAQAQQPQPSAASIAYAKEILTAKEAVGLLDPIIFGVLERTRQVYLQANPLLAKDLTDVATALRTEYQPRVEQLRTTFYRVYASKFTEAELKDLAAFFKSPIGQKLSRVEPTIFEQAAKEGLEFGEKFNEEVITRMRTEMKKRGHDL